MNRLYTLGRECKIYFRPPRETGWIYWGYVRDVEIEVEAHAVEITTRQDLRVRRYDKSGTDITLRVHFFYTDTDRAGLTIMKNMFLRGGETNGMVQIQVTHPDRENFYLGDWICTSLSYSQPVDGCVEATAVLKPAKKFHR